MYLSFLCISSQSKSASSVIELNEVKSHYESIKERVKRNVYRVRQHCIINNSLTYTQAAEMQKKPKKPKTKIQDLQDFIVLTGRSV